MENKTILKTWRLISHYLSGACRTWLLLSLALGMSLSLCSCVSVQSPEIWRCIDEHGDPIQGVIIFYSYSGQSFGVGRGSDIYCIISDSKGIAAIPSHITTRLHLPFEGQTKREINSFYSPSSRSGGGEGRVGYYENHAENFTINRTNKTIMIENNEDTSLWFIGLASAMGAQAIAKFDNPVRRTLIDEYRRFIKERGGEVLPSELHLEHQPYPPSGRFEQAILYWMQWRDGL